MGASTVALNIVVGAVNHARPVLNDVEKQVGAVSKAGTGSGIGSGISKAMDVASAATGNVLGILKTVGAVAGGVGRFFGAGFGLAGKAVSAVWDLLGKVRERAIAVAASMANIVKWIGLIGAAAVVKLGVDSVNAASDMEGYLAKLTVALKDTKKAQDMLDWAKVFAAKTPFEMPQVVDAVTRLEMYGLGAKKWLPLVGNMAGAMGKDVTDAVEAIADAVSGGGMERLKEFGINGVKLLAAGATPGPGGGVSSNTAESQTALKKALETILSRDFGGGMDKLSKTAKGLWSNFKDGISAFKIAVGEALMPAFKSVLNVGMKFLDWVKSLGVATSIGGALGKALIGIVFSIGKVVGAVALLARGNSLDSVLRYFLGGDVAEKWTKPLERLWNAVKQTFANISGALAGTGIGNVNFGDVILGVVNRVAGAIEWLNTNVFAPGKLQAIWAWLKGLYDGAVLFLGNLVTWVQTNFTLLGQWLNYFVGVWKYAVDWTRANLPGIAKTVSDVFFAVADVVLQVAKIVNSTGLGALEGVFHGLAFAITGLHTIWTTFIAAFVHGANIGAQALDGFLKLISGGQWNLDPNILRTMDAAATYAQALRDSFKEASAEHWTAAGTARDKAAARGRQISTAEEAIKAARASADKAIGGWQANTRPQTVPMPVAPAGQFAKWGQKGNAQQFAPSPAGAGQYGSGAAGTVTYAPTYTVQVNGGNPADVEAAVRRAAQANDAEYRAKFLQQFRQQQRQAAVSPG